MLDQQEYKAAISYYQQALQLNESINNQDGTALNYRDLGKAHVQVNQYDKALNYLQQAVDISRQLESPQTLMTLYEALAEAYAAQGNYAQAYDHRLKYFDIYQEVYNQEKEQQIAELETEYELDKKEQEITLQEQKIALLAEQNTVARYQRWGLIGGFVLFMALAGTWYNRQRLKAQKERDLREKDQLITAREIEECQAGSAPTSAGIGL